MEKIDFRKSLKQLYMPPSADFTIVEVPAMRYLMIDGKGDPSNSPAYVEAVEALYSVAYPLKFMSKALCERDYVVPPLEGLWWADDITAFVEAKRDEWRWTMMIMVPDWVPDEMVEKAKQAAAARKSNPSIGNMRADVLSEGLSVQIMHVGPYADEGPVLHRLHHVFMPEHGYAFNGKHHEIYIGDPRKTAPEKLKTVLRQPVISR